MILRNRLTAEAKKRGDVLVRTLEISTDRRGNVRLDARREGYTGYDATFEDVSSIVKALVDGDQAVTSEASLTTVYEALLRRYPGLTIWLRS